MKRIAALLLTISFILSGCGLFRGSYVSVTPHENTGPSRDYGVVAVSGYDQLRAALENMIHGGMESSVINVVGYDQALILRDMEVAAGYIRQSDPVGAYAVESIDFELGTRSAVPALAVEVTYRHGWSEIQQIQSARNMEEVHRQLGEALELCEPGIVLLVSEYMVTDLQQIAEDYGTLHPDTVMEVPVVTERTYPEAGQTRIVEIGFTYQNGRDDLRNMQKQVEPVFESAALYVSGNDSVVRKFSQLFSFLKERFSGYLIKTSITPSYSLLRHGVGDSKAFSMVYAQMCRNAGLDCRIVTGTRDGDPWCWNMVYVRGNYYHVDLLNTVYLGRFRMLTDEQMSTYVWDYSAYPKCRGEEIVLDMEPTEPETEPVVPPESTEPEIPETEPPVPETTTPTPPETEPTVPDPSEPETSVPDTSEPETTEPTVPETTAPTEPEVPPVTDGPTLPTAPTIPTDPSSPQVTEPVQTEPTQPEETTPETESPGYTFPAIKFPF